MGEQGIGSVGGARGFGERLLGALKLDASVFEEVEHDEGALRQAAAVVALGGGAHALGTAADLGLGGLVGGMIGGLLGWLVSTAFVWLVGVRLMHHTSDYVELLRTLGFASVPLFLLALGVVPLGPLAPVLLIAVFGLNLAAYVVAVRQALDVETPRALLVCVLAIAVNVLVALLLVGLMGLLIAPR